MRTADFSVGGEQALAMRFEVVDDPALPAAPAPCIDYWSPRDPLVYSQANGLIGLGTLAADCGATCESAGSNTDGFYYACTTPNTCALVTLSVAEQVTNPVALFPDDNNGVIVDLPDVGTGGAATVTGELIFGIGTQNNNALGGANVISLDANNGFAVQLDGQSFGESYIDSGTPAYVFSDTSIQGCFFFSGVTNIFDTYYCPTSTLKLGATMIDAQQRTREVQFRISDVLENAFPGKAAFDDVAFALPAEGGPNFIWGLPFFYGKRVVTAIEGAATPAGVGPYFAF